MHLQSVLGRPNILGVFVNSVEVGISALEICGKAAETNFVGDQCVAAFSW